MSTVVSEVAAPAAKVEPPRRACRCGHSRGHAMVSPVGEYTFIGWCLILVGISASPTAIKFVCRRCDAVIERTTDKEVIENTRLFG